MRDTRPPRTRRTRLSALALAGVLLSGCSMVGMSGLPAGLVDPAPPGGGSSDEVTGPPRATPRATPRRQGAPPRLRPFTLDLFRTGDFVAQYDGSWCVGASMQMMLNMIEPGSPDRTRATQARLYQFSRRVSPWIEQSPGASVYGWAEGLERLGAGGYAEMAAPTLQGALRLAARQMRATGRPVGLLVWDGKHAWVMSGFRATADPRRTDDFTVTHVWVEDPYSGRVSPGWGAGLRPHTLLTARALAADFVRHGNKYRPQYGERGMFVIVAPHRDAA